MSAEEEGKVVLTRMGAIMNVVGLHLDDIDADDDFNCRGTISPVDVAALADNIREKGLIQPGVVMPHPDPDSGYKYKLVAGFRRRMAIKILGLKTYSCIIREDLSVEDAMFMNLNENIQRKELNILQEALTIAKIKVFNPRIGRDGCAKKLGASPGWVQVREMLLTLPAEIQQEVVVGMISQAQIRELITIKKAEGVERCYEAAKEMKKAKLAGRKPRIVKKKNRDKVKERNREEIFEMMADINDSIPYKNRAGQPYLWPKVLAWASGEISDNDLFESCVEFAEREGHTWTIPSCDTKIQPEAVGLIT